VFNWGELHWAWEASAAIFLSPGLLGALIIQVYIYALAFPKDSKYIKALGVFCNVFVLLDWQHSASGLGVLVGSHPYCIHNTLSMVWAYSSQYTVYWISMLCRHFLVEGRTGDHMSNVSVPPLSGLGQFQSSFHLNEYLLCIIVAISVQFFFVWRIWKLAVLHKIIHFMMMGLISIVRSDFILAIKLALHDFRLLLELLLQNSCVVQRFVSGDIESRGLATQLQSGRQTQLCYLCSAECIGCCKSPSFPPCQISDSLFLVVVDGGKCGIWCDDYHNYCCSGMSFTICIVLFNR